MAMHTQSTLSSDMSARIEEAAALSPYSFHTKTEDESLDSDAEREGHGLDNEGHGLEDEGTGTTKEEEATPEGQQHAVLVVDTTMSEPLGLGYGALRRHELAVGEGSVPNWYEVGQSSRSVPEHEGAERVYAFRKPTLVTWVDPEDGRVYIDILTYAPPVEPVLTPPYPEWSSGSLPVSPSSLVVPSPIASAVPTPTGTISIDENLDALLPTLFEGYDRDLREWYTRSREARDDFFSQCYRLRSLDTAACSRASGDEEVSITSLEQVRSHKEQ
ncbi:hypothetical protein Tco_0054302 [Tanacetum coccineum]